MNETQHFGDYLKRVRISEGYATQKKLSNASGISQTTLSRIEAGTQKPAPETLRGLSKCFNAVNYGELMEKAGYLDGLPKAHKELVLGEYERQKKTYSDVDALTTINRLELEAQKLGMSATDPLFLEMLANAFELLRIARGQNLK